MDTMKKITEEIKDIPVRLVCGGSTRQDSGLNGIKVASGDIVCIHDGARALITPDLINKSIEDCRKYGAAALGVICKDTMKISDGEGYIDHTVDRETLYSIQTPQVFYKKDIMECHLKAEQDKKSVTDDCSLFELYGKKVYITPGSYYNIKFTTPEDLIIGELLLKKQKENL